MDVRVQIDLAESQYGFYLILGTQLYSAVKRSIISHRLTKKVQT